MAPPFRWLLPLLAAALTAQEAGGFAPETSNPWVPQWAATLRADKLDEPGSPSDSFQRLGAHLHLRWGWEAGPLKLEGGLRAAVGTDGNQFNAARWDQEPSNGTQADVASAALSWVSAQAFGSVTLGLQENALLVHEALWDRDLRLLGASGRLGYRSLDGTIQEAGLRAEAGRVRTILGGDTDVAAVQAVLKLDTGPFSWSGHAGRWDLSWDPGTERRRRLPGHDPAGRQRMAVDAVGASGTWHAQLPLEAHWLGARNRETGEDAEEAQLLVGSRERLYWPQLAATWQRLSSTGVLYPVNGDEWWFYRSARGVRLDLSLPLPGKWVATATWLRQRADGEDYQVTRLLFILDRHF